MRVEKEMLLHEMQQILKSRKILALYRAYARALTFENFPRVIARHTKDEEHTRELAEMTSVVEQLTIELHSAAAHAASRNATYAQKSV